MNDMAEKFEIQISKPKNNLPPAERKALKDLKNNTEINIKKADKGTTSVFMSLADKKTEGKIQLDNIEHHRPLDESMVEETSVRVEQLITELYREQHIDEMTKKWLCQTQNPPRIPVFYTLTKIHKPTPDGRPIISGVSGTTERLSAFVDELLQPIAQQQKSYLHSWTLWFIKATDSLPNQCSIFAHTTKLLRHSSTHISPRVTHQEKKEVSSKERPSDFSGQTQQKQHLKKKSDISNHDLSRGAIQKI